MNLLLTAISLVLAYLIVARKNIYALFIAMFMMSPAIIVTRIPFAIEFKRWITICLILYYIGAHIINRQRFTSYPLKKSLSLMFIGSVILIIFDTRFGLISRLLYPFLDAIDIYIVIFFAFFYAKDFKLDKLYKPAAIITVLTVGYGIFNYITGSNPIYFLIESAYGNNYSDGQTFERINVKSFCRYTFDFGLNCIFLTLYFLYLLLTFKRKWTTYILFLLSLVGVFICGSRTIIITAATAIIILIITTLNLSKSLKIFFTLAFAVLCMYVCLPPVQSMIDTTWTSIFTQSSEIEGSSVSMRQAQLAESLIIWARKPFLGNGFKYIFLELDLKSGNYSTGMFGYESIIYQILIERGILGVILYITFFVSVIFYFIRNKTYRYSSLGLSILFAFIVSAIGTGPLDSWTNTMILLGFIISNIEQQKKYGRINNNRQLQYKRTVA